MSRDNHILQGKGHSPFTRADVLQRLRQARAAGTNLNLTGEILSRSDLSGLDLSEANLSRANLCETNLSRSNLSWTHFSGANLSRSNLSEANLYRADLSRADLSRANLDGATLFGAKCSLSNFSGANLSRTDLHKVELSEAILREVILASNTLTTKQATITLQVHLEDEPFSSKHLVETMTIFRSLLTKLWLLRQGRMENFEQYTHQRHLKWEEEVPLDIRFSVNSPATLQFNFDWGPKELVEAFQQLVDIFAQWEQRRRKGGPHLLSQPLHIAEQSLVLAYHLVEAVATNLNDEQKEAAMTSVLKDLHAVAEDATFGISLLLPPLATPRVTITSSPPKNTKRPHHRKLPGSSP